MSFGGENGMEKEWDHGNIWKKKLEQKKDDGKIEAQIQA